MGEKGGGGGREGGGGGCAADYFSIKSLPKTFEEMMSNDSSASREEQATLQADCFLRDLPTNSPSVLFLLLCFIHSFYHTNWVFKTFASTLHYRSGGEPFEAMESSISNPGHDVGLVCNIEVMAGPS